MPRTATIETPVIARRSIEPGPTVPSLRELPEFLNDCRRCPLYRRATQGVAGEGRRPAALVLVGEQPGHEEDLAGKPFVGRAGRLLDRALAEAGVDRARTYVTNAVKHFKFEPRGKRRLHKRPNPDEIRRCRWWLQEELRLVRPKVILAMGTTAGYGVLLRQVRIGAERGRSIPFSDDAVVLLTVHPSALLRIPEPERRHAEFERLVADLRLAWRKAE
jgi:uracil-DNA glycosylase family protein